MPRISPKRVDVIASGLNSKVSINRQVIAAGGVAVPRDEHRVVFVGPHEGQGWHLQEYNGQSGGTPNMILGGRPAQFIAAGGGHVLAADSWGGGLYGTFVVPAEYTAISPPKTDNRGAASDDGTFAVSDATGQGFALAFDGGCSEKFFPGIAAYDVTVVRRGQAIIPINGVLETVGGLQKPIHVGHSARACWCEVPGKGAYIVHALDGKGLVARKIDSTKGKILESAGQSFHYDARTDGNGIRAAWATSTGELPEQIVSVWWDGESDQVELGGGSVEPIPPQTSQPMIQAFSHYGLVAPYFSFGRGYGETDDPIGNAVLLVEDPTNPQVLVDDIQKVLQINPNAILILEGGGAAQIPEAVWNQTLALWCFGGNMDELGAAVERCRQTRPEKRIIAYCDGRFRWASSRPSWLSDHVCPNLQCYRMPGEPLATFVAQMEEDFARVKAYGRPMGFSPRFDNFNGDGSVAQTLECMPYYEQWVRNHQLVDVLPFSDRREGHKPDGTPIIAMKSSPELRAWGRAFAYAFPERPNRFDYWIPNGTDIETQIRNTFEQSRIAVTLEAHKREYLLGLMDEGGGGGNGEEPHPGDGVEPDQLPPIVDAVWAKYGGHQDPGPDGIAHMINEVAYRANGNRAVGRWMLSHKPGGNRVKQPRTGTFVAWDCVQDGPTGPWDADPQKSGLFKGYDVFTDHGTTLVEAHQHNDPNRIGIAPVQPEM